MNNAMGMLTYNQGIHAHLSKERSVGLLRWPSIKMRPRPLGRQRPIVEQPLGRQKTCHTTTIKEAEAHCTTTIMETEAHRVAEIRDAESHCVDHAHAIQQSYSNNIQCLEREATEEEGKDWQSFLATCGMALQVWPPEACGVLMCPLQLLMGNMSLATLLATPSQVSTTWEEPTPVISHLATHVAPVPCSGTKWQHHLPNQAACSPKPIDEVVEASEELPHQKWKDGMHLKKLLKGGQWEAFSKDSDLVQQAREAYFRTSHPDFNHKVPCNLASLFWDMIISAGLLYSKIYEIQEIWMGPEDLWYANDVLKICQRVCSSSTPYPLWNHPRSWACKGSFTLMPFITLPG